MAKSTGIAITPSTVADLPAEAQQRVRHYQVRAQAKNTSRAYTVQLRAFNGWCRRKGYSDAPPVAPAIITCWLVERADAAGVPLDPGRGARRHQGGPSRGQAAVRRRRP
jgi:hypothetical protein